jgi:hypothetical protein
MSDVTLFERLLGVPEPEGYVRGFSWGWLIPRLYPMAADFFSYTDHDLVLVVPYTHVHTYTTRIYCVSTYCVGQLTATGKISESYKWEERMALHGIKPELIKKIKVFLEEENK